MSVDIENFIEYEEEEISKSKRRIEELELIREHDDMKIINVADGFFELRIKTDKLSSEIKDTLDFSIIRDSEIKSSSSSDKVIIECYVDYSVPAVLQ